MPAPNRFRLFAIFFGALFLVLSVSNLLRLWLIPPDIWWTPAGLALSLADGSNHVQILVRGTPLETALRDGSLGWRSEPRIIPLSPRDFRLRVNNRSRALADRILLWSVTLLEPVPHS